MFLCSCCDPHRDILVLTHSFPTRRSSCPRPRHGQRTVAADRRNRGGSGNLRGLPFTRDGADRQRPRERWSALAAEASGQAGDVLLLCEEFTECKESSRKNQI